MRRWPRSANLTGQLFDFIPNFQSGVRLWLKPHNFFFQNDGESADRGDSDGQVGRVSRCISNFPYKMKMIMK